MSMGQMFASGLSAVWGGGSMFLMVVLAIILGTIFGALPGVSATMAVALGLTFTYTMGPVPAIVFLVAYYLGATSCAMPFVDAVEIQSPGGTILLMAGFASLIVIFAFCTRNMLLEGETLRACIPGVLCLASAVAWTPSASAGAL